MPMPRTGCVRDLSRPHILRLGCLIAVVLRRSTQGFFLDPITIRPIIGGVDVFAFALALQNLLWGVGQPIAGMIADRFG